MKNNKKILVIDNDPAVADVVTSILKDISTIETVHTAPDIDSARSMLGNSEYCAILGNVNLVSAGGVTCVDLIKEAVSKYGDRYHKKILVMSNDIDKIVEALRGGAYMSIIKPLERTELRHKLSMVVNGHLKTPLPKETAASPQ